MARTGITQAQVDAAADALLKAGDRPTIDRVRALLGTGSPNTLIRLLDDWWSHLGQRLSAKEAGMALPGAPPEAEEAAGTMWRVALEHAKAWAHSQIEGERAVLRSDRSTMQQRAAAAVDAATKAEQREAKSVELLEASKARIGDLERLVAEQQIRLEEARFQLESTAARLENAETQLARANDELREQRLAETSRLEEVQAHIRSLEDRAHSEVDRAREEAKQAKQRVVLLEKEAVKAGQTHAQQLQKAMDRVRASDHEAVNLKGRLEALESLKERLLPRPARNPSQRHASKTIAKKQGREPRRQPAKT
jgi:chromosome segregation ATPase